jgi:N-acetylneuraminate synthase
MMKDIKILDRKIGSKQPPFIVAEMSGNHNQSLDRAIMIVEAAAKAGVDAIKLQTYTADTMTLNLAKGDFIIDDPKSPWHGYTLYQLYNKAHTPWEWHSIIFERCRELGLICFSTPFDTTAVDFLESLAAPCYKIASFENVDLPLIRKVASTGKPMIISTGLASIGELDNAVRTAHEGGCKDVILLKCTSSYPASPKNSHILTIPHMIKLFDCPVGLSDHTLGIGAAIGAVALGSVVIEKHFTLRRSDGGVDSAFSLEPEEMKLLVKETRTAWEALGRIYYGSSGKERPSMVFRRSIYITKDLKAGDFLTKENIRLIRPGYGLPPEYFDIVLGKKISKDSAKGTPLTWDLIG